MMNTSNNEERTIPRGDGMDAELISRLEQRLIDTEERLEENRRLIEEKGRLIEEKEKGMVWHKRILYGVIVVMAVMAITYGLRFNREDATVDTLSKRINQEHSFVMNKLVSSTPVTSDGGIAAGLTEAKVEDMIETDVKQMMRASVPQMVKEVQKETTKADFSPAFWHGTFQAS